jgi:hypothetical protein
LTTSTAVVGIVHNIDLTAIGGVFVTVSKAAMGNTAAQQATTKLSIVDEEGQEVDHQHPQTSMKRDTKV